MRESIRSSIRQSIRQSIRGSGGNPVPAFRLPLTEDLLPAMALAPVTASFTRATSATYVDDNGILQTVGNNVPRHTSKGVLIEGAGTNLQTYSTPGDLGTTWTNTNGAPVANYATAPDGTKTAVRLIDDGSTGTGILRLNTLLSLTASTQYANSFYVKADQLSWVRMAYANFSDGSIVNAYFDLSAGTFGTVSGGGSVGSEAVGDGWYRIWGIITAATDTSGSLTIYAADSDGGANVDLDGTSSILLWGVQLEAGSSPTSYIATTSSTAQRNADVLTYPAVGNADANQDMTIALEYTPTQISVDSHIFSINDGSTTDRVELLHNATTGYPRLFVEDGNVAQASVTDSTALVIGTTVKLAAATALNHFELYRDGVSKGTDSVGTLPATSTTITIGARADGVAQPYGWIKNVKIFNKRLTDAEVAAL